MKNEKFSPAKCVEKVLSVSTCHLSPASRDKIEDLFVVSYEYGWLMFVPSVTDVPEHLADLKPVVELARRLGCVLIRFDCDCPACEDLPVYDW